MDLARSGQYGRVNGRNMYKLEGARETMGRLLAGHTSASELKPAERIELYNAQQEFSSILRNDDKNRVVCQRVAALGTRVAKAECMTIAEREARAKAARDSVDRVQRNVCYAGEASRCAN
jgi:hypothetical protein